MDKVTNEDRARKAALVDSFYQKADKAMRSAKRSLDKDMQLFYDRKNEGKFYDDYIEYMNSGKLPSEFFKTRGEKLVDACVLKRHKDAFLYTIDNCTACIFQTGYCRRTFRSSDYSFYQRKIRDILQMFIYTSVIDADFADYLEDKLPEDALAYKTERMYHTAESFIIAYEIDMGNERVINYIKSALESGSDTAVSYKMLSGVFMSKNTELHEMVCKLLLAARLQEGLRQAICENADSGRIEPFLMVIKTIRDNNLIRYSSVKRAVGVWLGLMTEETRDLDRISGKSLDLIVDCLEDPSKTDEYLNTEDSMKIYIALWAVACREFRDAKSKIEDIIDNGTAHQALTAGVFAKNFEDSDEHKLAVKAILTRSDEFDVMAVFLPMMFDINTRYSYDEMRTVTSPMSERYDRATAEKLYAILNDMLEKLPKDMEFNPCVFPWNAEELTKSDIVKRLCVIAADLRNNDKIDETCVKIPLIKLTGYGSRSYQIEMLLKHPKTEVQLDTLVSLAGDKEENSRDTVFEILKKCKLNEKHYRMLEDMLRYKAADMRKSLMNVLFRQPEEELYECVKRLVTDKKEEKRTAGLDMIITVSEDKEKADLKEKYTALAKLIEAPTSKEKILIERISGAGSSEEDENALYSENDDYAPEVDENFIAECKKEFLKLFPTSSLFGNKPDKKKLGLVDKLKALDALIEEHKNDEYLDARAGETKLLVDSGYNSLTVKEDGETHIVFPELWDGFYKDNINDTELLFKIKLFRNKTIYNNPTKQVKNIYGEEFAERYTLMHDHVVSEVVNYLCDKYPYKYDLVPAACALGDFVAREAKTEDLYDIVEYSYSWSKHESLFLDGSVHEIDITDSKAVVTIFNDGCVNYLLSWISANPSILGDRFKSAFALRVMIGKRFGFFDQHEKSNNRKNYIPFGTAEVIIAAYKGVIPRGYMYKIFMNLLLTSALNDLSQLISFRKSGESKATSRYYNYRDGDGFIKWLLGLKFDVKLSEHELTEEENKLLDYAYEIGEDIINAVLKTELTRGDTETRYSKIINSINRIYGAENFVKILAALGKDTLDRSGYFSSYGGVSKKQSLSYLLGICAPDPDDNAEKLKELIKQTDVTENRIVEAALFSTAWLDIAQEYLGWDGFKSACYYFIAHTSEIPDEKTKAVIAKYTPISAEDLAEGAFDIDWFREALNTIGEERFDKIYKAAKYISDGSKHTRARKYADAVMGRMDKAEAVKSITDKRNKDTLMAYALIPFSGDNDIVERYLFIQEFKKQAKKFGAQRKASETAAAECALKNLSINAGYSDVSRLTLRMETKLFENIRPLLDWNEIEDIKLKLEVDEDGKTEILCEKNGKALKSIPAKLKKNEKVIEFTDTKKTLTEQYRRTRQMFEEAMENQTLFTVEELTLLCSNPAVKPIVSRLVYVCDDKLGFLSGEKLTDFSGNDTELKNTSELRIAHPFDLYNDGHWHEYQKYLFDNQIKQAFKQIFRELYVKTPEEATAFRSTRYAGNQINPQQTKACLKTRRWVCDIESGLQKIYYKENIIASIYALADWFSPADIEAPTLEWVEFFDRKTGCAIKIEDVPDIIFSEVMRDVDLAVSVAHAGGVDPETSHSTIEMRSAIIEFTLPLFKLTNVRLEKSHAFITGQRADYSIHLGSGVIHIQGGPMINVLPVHSQHRGKLFLPFVDEDPKTAQIISEILLFAEDNKIKDPFILDQIK